LPGQPRASEDRRADRFERHADASDGIHAQAAQVAALGERYPCLVDVGSPGKVGLTPTAASANGPDDGSHALVIHPG